MASVKACLKCAVAPFAKLSQKIEQTAVAKNASAPAAVKAQFEAYGASGKDFALANAQQMWKNRSTFFWFRIERAYLEGRYIASGEYFKGYNYKNAIVDAKFFTRLIAVFILGCFAGRGQIYPFVTPSSGYAIEMNH